MEVENLLWMLNAVSGIGRIRESQLEQAQEILTAKDEELTKVKAELDQANEKLKQLEPEQISEQVTT